MQIHSVNNSPQFRGFNNVISNICHEPAKKDCFAYMAMQLNNVGKKDLELWHTIQRKFMQIENPKDTITFSYFGLDDMSEFLISNYALRLPKEEMSTEMENIKLKAFSLIASLAERIKFKLPFGYDGNFSQTLLEAREDLLEIFSGDLDFVNNFMLQGITPDSTHEPAAKLLGDLVQKRMNEYFKD